ncbi:hypothetical protein HDU96_006108 [Phlyctochytrium bullatum]|nr:hypothetical protein HDU96_006108 [Phlyctochytrium bullatum]
MDDEDRISPGCCKGCICKNIGCSPTAAGILADEILVFGNKKEQLNLYSVVVLNELGVNVLQYFRVREIQLFPSDSSSGRTFTTNPNDVRQLLDSTSNTVSMINTPMVTGPEDRAFVAFITRDPTTVTKVVVFNYLQLTNESYARKIVGGYVELRRFGVPIWRSSEIMDLREVYNFEVSGMKQLQLPAPLRSSNNSSCFGGAGGLPFLEIFGDRLSEIRLYQKDNLLRSVEIQVQDAKPRFCGSQEVTQQGIDLKRIRFEKGDALIGVVVFYNACVRNVKLKVKNFKGEVREEGFDLKLSDVVKVELEDEGKKPIIGFHGRHGNLIDKLGVIYGSK